MSGNKHDDGIELTRIRLDTDGEKPSDISRQVSKSGNRHSLLELHVCLPDLTHVTLLIDQHTQATEIMDSIIESLGVNSAEARRVLSLWLVSSDLELQLKPNHCPVQLFAKWPVYLRKYTTVSEKLLHLQKPQVHLRRNVYISRDEDLKVTDEEILELLFTEARCNIMNGTYPCSRDLTLNLAGILCALQYGPYDEKEHTAEFYKSVHSILPLSIQSNSKLHDDICKLICFAHKSADRIDKAACAESMHGAQRIKAAYESYLDDVHTLPYYGANQAALFPVPQLNDCKALTHQLGQSHLSKTKTLLKQPSYVDLRITYLSECSDSLPFYGSVFFDGFIERVSKSFLHNSWLAVSIGANTDGIFVITSEKQEPILGILYEDLTWEYIPGEDKRGGTESQKAKSSKKDKVDNMPSLLLQYPADADDRAKGVSTQVLRVYSMSARLVDAFIETCSDILKTRIHCSPIPSPDVMLSAAGASGGGDAVDGLTFTKSSHSHTEPSRNSRESLEKSIRSLTKRNKLTCQSFTKDGKCVSA